MIVNVVVMVLGIVKLNLAKNPVQRKFGLTAIVGASLSQIKVRACDCGMTE